MAGGVSLREVEIVNQLGMHARPAAMFVKLASTFDSEVEIGNATMMVNGKSIMGVMMLAAECGSKVTIKATGPDADRAVEALAALVARGFDE
ncbi:MAG: HPr family phosphocarrier protein [Gemmatimonadales bacterium]